MTVKRFLGSLVAIAIMVGMIFTGTYFGFWKFFFKPIWDFFVAVNMDYTNSEIGDFFKVFGKNILGLIIMMYSFVIFKLAKFFMIDEPSENKFENTEEN